MPVSPPRLTFRPRRGPPAVVRALPLAAGLWLAGAAEAAAPARFAAPPPGNVPPTIQITCPGPSADTVHRTPPAVRVRWEGSDPDGQTTRLPVSYRHILLDSTSEFPHDLAVADPDSLRRYYANHPLGPWSGWDSTTATTVSLFNTLVPGREYVFAVIAFDEAGDYSPVFGLATNMLHFGVTFDDYLGPRLTLIGPGFEHRYPDGGWRDDPSRTVRVAVPEKRPVDFQWFAEPTGACETPEIRWYRWVLDPFDLFDETPRTDEHTDVRRWSARSLTTRSARVGPFYLAQPPDSESHRFYVEVEDNVGVRSLGIIEIVVFDVLGAPHPPAEPVLRLTSIHPNPTRAGAEIRFSLARQERVSVRIVDQAGRAVATIGSGALPAGRHVVRWDGSDGRRRALPPGLYHVVLEAAGERRAGRVAVIR